MTARQPGNPKSTREGQGHTVMLGVKLHPDLKAHLDRMADEHYCSAAEYLRQLIVADMRVAELRARYGPTAQLEHPSQP